MFEICISNLYESDFLIVLKNFINCLKKIVLENVWIFKIFFLLLSNCVNIEIYV